MADFPDGWAALALGAEMDVDINLGECDYFLGVGSCTFGCYEEPECMTCVPPDGWPQVERHPYAEFLLSARRLSYRTQNWSSWQSLRRFMERKL